MIDRSKLTGHPVYDTFIIRLQRETILTTEQARYIYLAVGDYEMAVAIAKAYTRTRVWGVVDELIRWSRTANPSVETALATINEAVKYSKWWNRLGRWIKGAIKRWL